MKQFLLVGLGNPGGSYARTRHNAGWLALDHLARLWADPAVSTTWKFEKKLEAETLRLTVGDNEVLLLKPQTFMNDSGRAVAAALKWYFQVDPAVEAASYPQLVVIHDDLDLTTGQYKLQFESGPKVHNGVNSVRTHLHSSKFWSARLGVDSRGGTRAIPGQAYVLQPFQPDEETAVREVVATLAEELPYVVLQ